jgi:hypothetical protein
MHREDPVVRSARREAAFAICLWALALVYTVSVCYAWGYERRLEEMTFVLWFPDWVFWGVVVPWCVCIAVSTWFAFRSMGDEALGEERSPGAVHTDAEVERG